MAGEINFEASAKQGEAWEKLTDNVTTEIGYGGAAHGGKSFLLCFWEVAMCLAYPGNGWGLGRKELKNLKLTTLLTFYEVCEKYRILPGKHFKTNEQLGIVTFSNGSQIFLLDLAYQPSDPLYTRLGGLQLTGAGVDQSEEVEFKAIDILSTRVGRRLNDKYHLTPKVFETFNPAKNHVYQRFYKPWRSGELPKHRAFIQALPTDNPHTPPSYIEQLKRADKITRERLLSGKDLPP